MYTSLYAIEKMMLERKDEIEKTALISWQWNTDRNKKRPVSQWIRKVNFLKSKTQVQTITTCNCCC